MVQYGEHGITLGTGELARALGVRRETVRRWIGSGRLPAVRRSGPGPYRVRLADAAACARGCGVDPAFVLALAGDFLDRPRPQESTPHLPGSPAKLEVLAARLERGEQLHHPDDRPRPAGERPPRRPNRCNGVRDLSLAALIRLVCA